MFKKKFSLIFVVFFVLFSACSKNASFTFLNLSGENLNKDSQIQETKVKKGDEVILNYKFSDEIKNQIVSCRTENLSLNVNLELQEKGNGRFIFGFLYEKDFDDLKNLSKRAFVSGDFSEFSKSNENQLCISMNFSKKDKIEGFFVKSFGNIQVAIAFLDFAKVGFDYESGCLSFAFSSNGGKISSDFQKKVDFVSCKDDFNAKFPKKVTVKFNESANKNGKVATVLTVNKEKFYVRKSNNSDFSEFDLSAVKNPYGLWEILENQGQISSIFIKDFSSEKVEITEGNKHFLTPIKIDPGLVIWYPMKNWRGQDYELFEWDRFPGIILMDIADYNIQDDFFRRIAYFVEKAGFRGKLYSDEFLAGKHGYNAHDYRAESLAEFYEKARTEKFKLNDKELLLKRILVENGVLREENGKILPGRGAVISISQSSQMYLRTQFIAHEGWHGIFFIDEDFRKFIYDEYEKLEEGSKKYLIRYFQVTPSLNYDINDEYLLRNEFMAYMLQRPVSDIKSYFMEMAGRRHSQDLAKKEADYILATEAEGFVEASKRLDAYVNKRWNLNAGRVWLSN